MYYPHLVCFNKSSNGKTSASIWGDRVMSSSSLLLPSLELSDANVDEPRVRARLGTAAHFRVKKILGGSAKNNPFVARCAGLGCILSTP